MKICLKSLAIGLLASSITSSICPGSLMAQPVQWRTEDGGNGHYYDFVSTGLKWHEARDAAASISYRGFQGHLATITSSEENMFLRQVFSGEIGDPDEELQQYTGLYGWIGLTDEVLEGVFRWVTGEPFNYSNWAPGEPNNYYESGEDYVHYWNRNFGSNWLWTWNDAPSGGHPNPRIPQQLPGYFVEYSNPCVAIPEPSNIAATFLGGLAISICYLRRKSRCNSHLR